MAQTKLEVTITDEDERVDIQIRSLEPVKQSQLLRHLSNLADVLTASEGDDRVELREFTATPVGRA